MNRILIAGCGDVAIRVSGLLPASYQLFGLLRNTARQEKLRAAGITPLIGDLDKPHSLRRLCGLAHTILHFAPPPALEQNTSTPLSQRGAEGGFAFKDTRTHNLLAALSQGTLPKRLIYISTSGVYGDCNCEEVSETRPLHAQTARAQLRVSAEKQIRNWAKCNGVHASILRVPGIYAADRLPVERLKKGTPAIVDAEDGYTNHIHADDLARCVIAALLRAKPNRIYHTVDDSRMKMGEYFDAVADAFGLPHAPRVTRAEAQRGLSPMLLSFMNESRRLNNRRMKQELKVVLRYPTVTAALSEIKPSGFAESAAPVCASPRQMQLSLPLS
jgi:nucleoside-diphosphate-sugar epimerase